MMANTITAREDRGVSEQKQTGTAVAIPIGGCYGNVSDDFQRGILDGEMRTLRACGGGA